MSTTEKNPDQANSNVLFFDDFSSGELDRTKWNVRTTGSVYNQEQQAYIDSPETIYFASPEEVPGAENGALVLHARHHPGFTTPEGDRFDFISGRMDTREKFTFMYGRAAARMKLPAGAGLWPAFWALGQKPWPESGEIDIMEYVGEPDWVSAAVHGPGFSGESALVNKLYFQDPAGATAWHVYAVDWTPDKMIFTVDDVLIYRVTRPMVDFFGPWVFADQKYLILNLALGGTYPFKTNGVRSPYYGMPESTAQSIKDGMARVFIDWVKVERN